VAQFPNALKLQHTRRAFKGMQAAQQSRHVVLDRNSVFNVKDKAFDLGDVFKPLVNKPANVFFPVYCHEPFRI